MCSVCVFQAPIETIHAGCRFENLVCCPGNTVAGTMEGDRLRGPVDKTWPLPFLCRPVLSADKEDLLQAPPRLTARVYFPCPITLRAGGHDAVTD